MAKRKYKTAADLQKKIDAYFKKPPQKTITVKTSLGLKDIKVPDLTITGLCLHLGFCSRQSFYDLEKVSDAFSYTIKRARLQIEHEYEIHLVYGNTIGGIFGLKNFGWIDTVGHHIEDVDDLFANINIILNQRKNGNGKAGGNGNGKSGKNGNGKKSTGPAGNGKKTNAKKNN
jgi:hypothetical protein